MNDHPDIPKDADIEDTETSEAMALFREALEKTAPEGGLDRLRQSLRPVTQRKSPRHFGIRIFRPALILPVSAAAAICIAAVSVINLTHRPDPAEPLSCPHSNPESELLEEGRKRPSLREFLSNPDRFDRVCQCSPTYSGNLRPK